MFIFEEMKVNKFKLVRIPSKGEYFNTGRYIAEKGMYGGEEGDGINAAGTNKVEETQTIKIELERHEKDEE